MDLGIKGKTAVVGGSSKGLGRASAIALAKAGANIVLCARNKEALLQTKKEIALLGAEVIALTVDMASETDNRYLVDQAVEKFGGVDILVNNSGGPKPGTFRDITFEDLDEAYHSVLKYNIRMINLCLPYMEQKKWGRIVNITSMTVKEPAPNMVLSNIFRSAVASYAKTISKELIGLGITINNVCPGYFKTDRIAQLVEANSKAENITSEMYEERVTAAFPHKRYMDPQELGDYVGYLCSEQARSITGTTVQLDGGLLSGLL